MKVLSVQQIRDLDNYTIRHKPIASLALMERAGTRCADWILEHFPASRHAFILCGSGNNGGDGLVVARRLAVSGWDVMVAYPVFSTPSKDFSENLKRLSKSTPPVQYLPLEKTTPLPQVSNESIVVDALFGSGLSRPLEGPYASWVTQLNAGSNIVLSIDIPSGVFADQPTHGVAVRADFTLSFEVPKRAFFIPENQEFVGEWVTLTIGLDQQHLASMDAPWQTLELADVGTKVRTRRKFDHKGVFGHALLIVGSYGKAGAAIMASKAALRSGAGLVTAHVPGLVIPIIQTALPEAMTERDADAEVFSGCDDISKYTVVGIGSGIGQEPQTVAALRQLLGRHSDPMVLDADALNILAQHRELLQQIPAGSVLTPHFKEFERLFGKSADHFGRLKKASDAAVEYHLVIVLKGAHTAVATPDGTVYFNTTGNPGMATAGSGDVLTGVITGLMAQGYDPETSATLGVYLHGLAGDLAAGLLGYEAILAGDIIEHMAGAWNVLHEHRLESDRYPI